MSIWVGGGSGNVRFEGEIIEMGEEPYERRAKMNKSIKTLFPDQEDRTCAVCKEGLGDDKRRKRYCSGRCKDIAYAVQRLFLWRKVRNEFMEEAEEVCQRCGYDPEYHKEELSMMAETIENKYDEVKSVHMERTREMQADHIKPVAKGGERGGGTAGA